MRFVTFKMESRVETVSIIDGMLRYYNKLPIVPKT